MMYVVCICKLILEESYVKKLLNDFLFKASVQQLEYRMIPAGLSNKNHFFMSIYLVFFYFRFSGVHSLAKF